MKNLVFAVSAVAVLSTSAAQASQLSDSIPYPYYEVQKSSEGHTNKIMILNSGIASLEKRLEIIRKAKKHIEVEYFIYALDQSSNILTAELVKAAKRGVRVRILVDKSSTIFQLDEYYAHALKSKGIEVKYYNDAATIRVSSINFRNHRKLLSVDDTFAITGGRNVEDDYYDFSSEFNFLDRDVYVEGDIVATMRKSFDKYFEHDISVTPSTPKAPSATVLKRYKEPGSAYWQRIEVPNTKAIKEHKERIKKAQAFLTLNKAAKEKADMAANIGSKILAKKKLHECPVTTFSTDAPGGDFLTRLVDDYGDDYRFLRKTLFDKLISADKAVIISSPYMINSPKSLEIYAKLIAKGMDVSLYTNSMASTDALYVAANLYRSVFSWAGQEIKTYIHSGEYIDENEVLDQSVEGAAWGTHSKTQIYEYNDPTKNEFMIGTYNVDNRSNHYNSEMAIFCQGSQELFNEVKGNVVSRMDEGYLIHENFTATDKNGDRVSVFGADRSKLPKMLLMALPSWLLNLLL